MADMADYPFRMPPMAHQWREFVEHKDDLVRARLEPDGTITHLEPPEYHGNPIDPENGALCFRYFGWDITHMLQEAGFTDVSLHFYWSRRLGYLGPTNSVIVARA